MSKIIGYVYHNPDTGIEFSETHPVRSGEVSDAENIRRATAPVLLGELLDAWRALDEQDAAHAQAVQQHNAYAKRDFDLRTAAAEFLRACGKIGLSMVRVSGNLMTASEIADKLAPWTITASDLSTNAGIKRGNRGCLFD